MPDGKQIILLTLLPGGKRLASLRAVEEIDRNARRYHFALPSPGGDEAQQESPGEAAADQRRRQGAISWDACVEVKGGDRLAPGGLGLGIRRLTIADLTASPGDDDEAGENDVLEVFEIDPDAAFYLVRGTREEKRGRLLDKLQEALPHAVGRSAAAPPGYQIMALPEEKMRALGWVRVERLQEEPPPLENNDEHAPPSDDES